jgi:hypothetical protein
MSEITIRFRAKRGDYADGFKVRPGYKVPTLTYSHVSVVNRDARAQLFLQGLNNRAATEARLRKAGVSSIAFEHDAQWTIRPIGNGYMADVSRTISV